MAETLHQLAYVRSDLGLSTAAFLSAGASRLLARPNAFAHGIVRDAGLDLRLRVTTNAVGNADTAALPEGAWLREIQDYLEQQFSPPPTRESTFRHWLQEPAERGSYVLLADGGAGKSWSTAREIARLAEEAAKSLQDSRLDLRDPWLVPLWVHAPALADFLVRLEEFSLKAGVARPAEALERFLCFLFWEHSDQQQITNCVPEPGLRAWRARLAAKLKQGCFVIVFDAINELGARTAASQHGAFHDIINALHKAAATGPGRLVLCCRRDIWGEPERKGWLPREFCRVATRCALLPLDVRDPRDRAKIVEMFGKHGAGTGGIPSNAVERWWELLDLNDELRDACCSPLMLALTLSTVVTSGTVRGMDSAGILDGAVDGFLDGCWRENRLPITDQVPGFPPGLDMRDKLDTAKALISLTAWALFSEENAGTNAFSADGWVVAFEKAAAELQRTNVLLRLPDVREQAHDWLLACREQGLIVRGNSRDHQENGKVRYRYLHQLLFQYLAAYGLAMQDAGGYFRSDPWKRAFAKQGLEHGRVKPDSASLFCLLPGALAALRRKGNVAPQKPAGNKDAVRLGDLCRFVRRSIALDLSGLTVVVRLAVAVGCPEIGARETTRALLDTMKRFSLDREITRLGTRAGALARSVLIEDVESGVEAQVRQHLRMVPRSAVLQERWVAAINRWAQKRRLWGMVPGPYQADNLSKASGWLLAIGATGQAEILALKTIRCWTARMTIPMRIVAVRTLEALSRAAPSVIGREKIREVACSLFEDAMLVMSLPHAVDAIPLVAPDLAVLHGLAAGEPAAGETAQETSSSLWQDAELRAIWNHAAPLPACVERPASRRKFLRTARSFVESAAAQRCDFWLWFKVAYLYRSKPDDDRLMLGLAARFLIRKRLPDAYFYRLAVAVGLIPARGSHSPGFGLGMAAQDFAYLRPRPGWPYVSRAFVGFYWVRRWTFRIVILVYIWWSVTHMNF